MSEVSDLNSFKPEKEPSKGKKQFVLDFGTEKVEVEGYEPHKALIKYLMKRRRSLLFTRDPAKVELIFNKMPTHAQVISLKTKKSFDIKWERVGTGEFQGARFTFELKELN